MNYVATCHIGIPVSQNVAGLSGSSIPILSEPRFSSLRQGARFGAWRSARRFSGRVCFVNTTEKTVREIFWRGEGNGEIMRVVRSIPRTVPRAGQTCKAAMLTRPRILVKEDKTGWRKNLPSASMFSVPTCRLALVRFCFWYPMDRLLLQASLPRQVVTCQEA